MMETKLPSLMQAARSAAEADGLVPSRNEGNLNSNNTTRILSRDESNVTKDDQSKKEEAAAGLAMVADAAVRKVHKVANNAHHAMELARNAMQSNYSDVNKHSLAMNLSANGKNAANGGVAALADAAAVASAANNMIPTNAFHAAASNLKSNDKQTPTGVQLTAHHVPSSEVMKPPQPTSGNVSKPKGSPLRRGKWTTEEEAYANRLILEFKAGLLPLTDGTTLRTFLSKLLNCDPMRISKKFVGNKCIGKQVFRRRTADINKLTKDEIETSRSELSELERKFLDRVAQTNRVKSNGSVTNAPITATKIKQEDEGVPLNKNITPPWLRPPNGFNPAASKMPNTATNTRAAAAGRALLQVSGNVGSSGTNSMNGIAGSSGASGKDGVNEKKGSGGNSGTGGLFGNDDRNKESMDTNSCKPNLTGSRSHESSGLLAMAELQRRRSQQNMAIQSAVANALQKGSHNSTNSLLDAALASGSVGGFSNLALAQIARNASAARLAGLAASSHSLNSLLLKSGLSRDQLTQLARDNHASSQSLSNLLERQSSFDALMSLDFQSLQSIDNLANLIRSGSIGGGSQTSIPKSGLKNWESGSMVNLNSLANGRREVTETRMESLIRTLSNGNIGSRSSLGGNGSKSTSGSLLQSMQNASASSLLSSGNLSNAMLANMLRVDSSTGLTALRMQDGLAQRNSSVDDFLSLVASGDIPHQDPYMLNVPLQSVMQKQQQNGQHLSNQNENGSSSTVQAAATYLAQQQLLAQAANENGNGLNNAMSLGLGSNSTVQLMDQLSSASHQAAAYAQKQRQKQARALQMNLSATALAAAARAQQQQQQQTQHHQSSNDLKRKLTEETNAQGPSKR